MYDLLYAACEQGDQREGVPERHEAHSGIRSFTQDIAELKVICTETTIGRAAARFGL